MKIGFFDSGLGGLQILKTVSALMPAYDKIYFGDTLHAPYGSRSREAIYEYSKAAMDYLFESGCALIIIACNTASAAALRRLQQEYLPQSPYAERRILGVVVPTLEVCIERDHRRIGLIGTDYIVESGVYKEELANRFHDVTLHAKATPLLAPMIDNQGLKWIKPILEDYLQPLKSANISSLILGCTHYACLAPLISDICGNEIEVISQADIIPQKLQEYLAAHPEIEGRLGKNYRYEFYVSDKTLHYEESAKDIYNEELTLERITT